MKNDYWRSRTRYRHAMNQDFQEESLYDSSTDYNAYHNKREDRLRKKNLRKIKSMIRSAAFTF